MTGPFQSPRAAEYVRMSTDLQNYSIENQRTALALYAAEHGMEVVRSYVDAGKSGLSIDHRDGLKTLLRDVLAGEPGFGTLLVYDVSRWGRFQDADEGAHYEFLLRSNGINVIYCAEPFDNDGTPLNAVLKGLKRAMAGEYSRELSVKISAGKNRLVANGFYYGSSAGFGLRRVLVDAQGAPKAVLEHGQRKNIQSDRVVLAPGPPDEVELVRRIYSLFLDEAQSFVAIARLLNAEGRLTEYGRPWSHYRVRAILSSEKYIGNYVFNRTSAKLHAKTLKTPPETWLRVKGAFEGIIDPERFERAQQQISARVLTDTEMLTRLRALLRREGKLSQQLIDRAPDMPGARSYTFRFDSLFKAYSLVGYTPPSSALVGVPARARLRQERKGREIAARQSSGDTNRRAVRACKGMAQRLERSRALVAEWYVPDEDLLGLLRELLKREGKLTTALINHTEGMPSAGSYRFRFGSLYKAYDLIGYSPPFMRGRSAAYYRRCLQLEKERRWQAMLDSAAIFQGADDAGEGDLNAFA